MALVIKIDGEYEKGRRRIFVNELPVWLRCAEFEVLVKLAIGWTLCRTGRLHPEIKQGYVPLSLLGTNAYKYLYLLRKELKPYGFRNSFFSSNRTRSFKINTDKPMAIVYNSPNMSNYPVYEIRELVKLIS
jgi:hypothetical protein